MMCKISREREGGGTPEQLDHYQYLTGSKQAGRHDFLATARILNVGIIYIVHEFLADRANLLG